MIFTNIDNHLISTFHKIYGLNNISIFGKQDVKEIPLIYKWQLKNINFLFIFWIKLANWLRQKSAIYKTD